MNWTFPNDFHWTVDATDWELPAVAQSAPRIQASNINDPVSFSAAEVQARDGDPVSEIRPSSFWYQPSPWYRYFHRFQDQYYEMLRRAQMVTIQTPPSPDPKTKPDHEEWGRFISGSRMSAQEKLDQMEANK